MYGLTGNNEGMSAKRVKGMTNSGLVRVVRLRPSYPAITYINHRYTCTTQGPLVLRVQLLVK